MKTILNTSNQIKAAAFAICMTAFVYPHDAEAHGKAGQRLFPATLQVEDPAVADELTLPHFHSFKENEDGETGRVTEYEAEFSKRLTERLGFSIEGAFVDQSDEAGGNSGFENWGLSAKYQALKNDEHEMLISIGFGWDIGDSGNHDVGAEDFSTLTPQVFFGKGFGDLPASLEILKPLALTGSAGVAMPLEADETKTLTYGFTIQYSLPYLQQHVRDVGLNAPFDNMIPVVEFTFDTPLDNTDSNQTTGTINPGMLWSGENVQFGLEAVLPLNSDSGDGVGISAQVQFPLDDILSGRFGRPIFGH